MPPAGGSALPGSTRGGGWLSRVRGPWLAVALFGAVCAGGTLGYSLLEGWHPWDAFYMTVTTVTTVGF